MALIMIMIWAAIAQPENWLCRNDVEIRCNPEACEVARDGEFTPMHVNVDDAGLMNVCAYSGCWEGTGTVIKREDILILIGEAMPFSTSPDSVEKRASIVVSIDRSDSIGIVKVGAFAQPLRCERGTQE